MKLKFFVLPAAAMAAASILIAPEISEGYVLLGTTLSLSQRDVRVFDNFSDASANDNTTPDPDWPGYTGTELAIWKACVEWSSQHHNGTGAGDPTQEAIGDGWANFDPSWQGNAIGIGGTNDNVHSELSGTGGGVLAFCEGPSNDGWRIRYYSNQNWHDGPDQIATGTKDFDIQGVATHEYGHALGLDHTTFANSTMIAFVLGNGVPGRSIEADDIAGVQAAYGAASPGKPRITGVSLTAGMLTVTGNGFAPSGNEVWLTQAGVGGTGNPIKATGLVSTGGSTITLALPAGAGSGDVLVKQGGATGHASLSNPFALDAGPKPLATAVNVDLGLAMGTPSPSQGGAAGSAGEWNAVDPASKNVSLFGPALTENSAQLRHDGSNGEFSFDDPSSTGSWEKLFDDGHDVECNVNGGSVTYDFDGFAAGTYDVYVYAWTSEDPLGSLTDVTLTGGSKGTQTCGGIVFQPAFVDGGNYVVDRVTIPAGGTIQVVATRNQGCARVNGFQILPSASGGVASYCTAGTSASGCQAVLSAAGIPSASAGSGFVVHASGVEAAKDGLFFFGTGGQQANGWGNGTSFQCVVPPVTRAGQLQGTGTSGACNGSFGQDLNSFWAANPAKNPGPGAVVQAQLWYRDPLSTSNQTTSMSDALEFQLAP